jgi:F0F1-type ATP synthase membrane subunit a
LAFSDRAHHFGPKSRYVGNSSWDFPAPCAFGFVLRRAIPKDPEAPPPRRLVLLIFLVDFVENQVLGGTSEKLRRSLFPLIATLFLFVWTSNISSILPIPGMVAPTQDLNVTLGLALLVYSLTHVYGMRTKGVFRHLKGYLEPIP